MRHDVVILAIYFQVAVLKLASDLGTKMSDASMNAPKGALLTGPGAPQKPQSITIAQVMQDHGVHPLRQMREIFAMRGGRQKLGSNEYYSLRLYDPAIAMAQKREFLGQGGTNALNARMNPPTAVPTRSFVGNKLLYTQLLEQLGIPTARTQAMVSGHLSAGKVPVLRDAGILAQFLRNEAIYPIFGKPYFGSLSEGSVRIEAREDDMLRLANGEARDLTDFAAEVMTRYPGGFLLQSALDPHADMARIAGPAIGCVRVLTANDGSGPKPAYAVWKLPAPMAMSDNFWQDGSLLADLDLGGGMIKACLRGTSLSAEMLTRHPVSNAPLVGAALPFWSETLEIAVEAHAVFPEFGVCGFDIAVTNEGPKVLECNDNPAHMLYQLAARRGLENPDLAPIWARVVARQEKQVARMKAAMKKRR